MSTLREVSPSEVLALAMSLVRSARTEILATMNLGEELAQPLPEEYFLLLEQKMKSSIHVTRGGFGSNRERDLFLQTRPINSANEQFVHVQNLPYRRMLMIDKEKMLFVKQEKENRKIYFTDKPEIIDLYSNYFRLIISRNDTRHGHPPSAKQRDLYSHT